MKARMGEEQALALALEGRIHAAQGETAQLVALAGNLALLPDPEIDAAFATALEEQLLNGGVVPATARLQAVPAEPAPAVAEPPLAPVVRMPRRRLVLRRSVASIAVAASLAAFPVAMAANSLPGSPFYGIKLAMEDVWDARPGTPVERAFRHLGRANERLGEAAQLVERGADRDDIDTALRLADEELAAARDVIRLDKNSPADTSRFYEAAARTERRIQTLREEIEPPAATLPSVGKSVPTIPVASVAPAPAAVSAPVSHDTAKRTARKQADEAAEKTGTGKEIREVEGCTPPASTELSAAGAGDSLAFMCRAGMEALIR